MWLNEFTEARSPALGVGEEFYSQAKLKKEERRLLPAAPTALPWTVSPGLGPSAMLLALEPAELNTYRLSKRTLLSFTY